MEINYQYFQPPLYEEQLKYARKGMLRPEPDKLHVGHYYYRIGHANDPVSPSIEELTAAFSSPWWMDYQTLKSLMAFAEFNSISLTVSGRIKNAVAHAFGKSNILVRGLLKQPTRALIGAGRPIESEGTMFFPPGDIKQIFIPGLYGTDLSTQIFPAEHRGVDPIFKGEITVRDE
ncbi:MAG: hypothetical protein R3208_05095 [Ketobacteraceae bacterium]|nr:hypothetical protein [Ketobacteraceae bacterium]